MKKSSSAGLLIVGLNSLVDIIFTGLLWLLFCLPVLTAGPASTALYHTIVKSVRHGRSHAGRTFFAAFRDNFKSSILSWLVFLFLIVLWFINNFVTAQTDPEGLRMMTRVSVFLIIPVCFPLPWLFAYISRFENSLGDTLKFAVYLSVKYFVRTLIMFAIIAVFVFIGRLSPVLIPILPGFCCLFMSSQTEPVFKSITENMDGDSNEDQWYNE